jgi:AraC-like DNA-binding protein
MTSTDPLAGLRVLDVKRFTPQAARIALPDACCDIVIVRERAWLLGPMTRGQPTRHPGEALTLLKLSHLSARSWLGMPLSELTDRRVPLDELRPHATEALLSSGFSGRSAPSTPPLCDLRLAAAARALRRGETVASAAASVDLSARQIERLFLASFGMGPKRFAQVVRFRRAMIAVGQGCNLAAAAQAYGYADQAHFSRAARQFMGKSLAELRRHVAIVQDRPAMIA